MTNELLNKSIGLTHLISKAGRLTSKRYVCFTKKYLSEEFVLMKDSDDLTEIRTFYEDLPISLYDVNPRLIFDQLEGIILETHNANMVKKTMERIAEEEKDKNMVYVFRFPNMTWSTEKYVERMSTISK